MSCHFHLIEPVLRYFYYNRTFLFKPECSAAQPQPTQVFCASGGRKGSCVDSG